MDRTIEIDIGIVPDRSAADLHGAEGIESLDKGLHEAQVVDTHDIAANTGANARVLTTSVDVGLMLTNAIDRIERDELAERTAAQSRFLSEELKPLIESRLKAGAVSSKELSELIHTAIMQKDPSWETWGAQFGAAELIRETIFTVPCYYKIVNSKKPRWYKDELPYYPDEEGDYDTMTVAVTKQGHISIQLSPDTYWHVRE